jgi:hypothetical protein
MTRRALRQSSRYANLSYMSTAHQERQTCYRHPHQEAESSLRLSRDGCSLRRGSLPQCVCTTSDLTKSIDAPVYSIDSENKETRIAHPTMLSNRNIMD